MVHEIYTRALNVPEREETGVKSCLSSPIVVDTGAHARVKYYVCTCTRDAAGVTCTDQDPAADRQRFRAAAPVHENRLCSSRCSIRDASWSELRRRPVGIERKESAKGGTCPGNPEGVEDRSTIGGSLMIVAPIAPCCAFNLSDKGSGL